LDLQLLLPAAGTRPARRRRRDSKLLTRTKSANVPGWQGYNPNLYNAEVMIGETFSGVGCLANGGSTAADSIVDGYNASDLTGGNTFIARPWFNLIANFSWPEFTGPEDCYPFEMSVTPPYSGTP
jgi:hypothetical protein